MLLVNVFDQIPNRPRDSGYPQHGHPMDQIDSRLGKPPCMPSLPLDKRHFGPSQIPTALTPKRSDPQAQKNRAPARSHQEKPSLLEIFLPGRLAASTLRAVLDSRGHLCPEHSQPFFIFRIFCADVLDSSQSKGMTEQKGGHGGYPLVSSP